MPGEGSAWGFEQWAHLIQAPGKASGLEVQELEGTGGAPLRWVSEEVEE